MFAGGDCPSGAQRTSSFLTTGEVIIREGRIRYAFWCRLGRGPRLNYHQYRGMRRIINLKRLFGIPLTCLYATVSRRSHNIINSSSLSFNNKIDMSSHSRLSFSFPNLCLFAHSDDYSDEFIHYQHYFNPFSSLSGPSFTPASFGRAQSTISPP